LTLRLLLNRFIQEQSYRRAESFTEGLYH